MLPHSIESRPYSLVYTGDPHCHLPRTSGERGSGASRTVSTADRSCTDLTEKPQHVAVIYHAEVQVVVVVQVAQQVHPPGVIIIAVRPTEVAPTLLENLNISVASFHEKLINAEKLQ